MNTNMDWLEEKWTKIDFLDYFRSKEDQKKKSNSKKYIV